MEKNVTQPKYVQCTTKRKFADIPEKKNSRSVIKNEAVQCTNRSVIKIKNKTVQCTSISDSKF